MEGARRTRWAKNIRTKGEREKAEVKDHSFPLNDRKVEHVHKKPLKEKVKAQTY